MELDDKTFKAIEAITNKGNELLENGLINQAIYEFETALSLVPEPKNIWIASTWIYTALGDSYFLMNNFNSAIQYFLSALDCPDGQINPFINLRLGQCYYEKKMIKKATEYLMRAYMLDGEEVFTDEPIKYFQLIRRYI